MFSPPLTTEVSERKLSSCRRWNFLHLTAPLSIPCSCLRVGVGICVAQRMTIWVSKVIRIAVVCVCVCVCVINVCVSVCHQCVCVCV